MGGFYFSLCVEVFSIFESKDYFIIVVIILGLSGMARVYSVGEVKTLLIWLDSILAFAA